MCIVCLFLLICVFDTITADVYKLIKYYLMCISNLVTQPCYFFSKIFHSYFLQNFTTFKRYFIV